MWAVLVAGGVFVVVSGLLPGADAREIALDRGAPVIGFLVAITILAELADRAGVFDAAATWCARVAAGSTARLFLLIAVLATATTAVMSLDTTAVLLTPVVLALAARIGVRPLPFALLVVWLANTGSMFLPISNLTNLLALQREHVSTYEFVVRMALPATVAVLVTVGYLFVLFRKDLSGRYAIPAAVRAPDGWTFWVCAAACVGLVPLILLGVAPWLAGALCAVVATAVFAVRDRSALGWYLLPWRLIGLTTGLFLVVITIAEHGLTDLLGHLMGDSPLRAVVVAALSSNVVNNLPAYLAMEPAIPVGDGTQHFAVLLGTNAGPLVVIWGSLATLLWRERCKARGVDISWRTFGLVGLGGVPLVLAASTVALLLTAQPGVTST
ncbi:SLC13 family permease [Antrihabitans sp. YC2-6]|uniref:SLC13 family permease n=1 Tax=Antrihabitans sp. YC2-6 TaxID=2799498 RepID=UPI0018F3F600|nr:SLC13 family permease [Antrihabitans sp. YC2-6]MBJ8345251.1 arsenic transporter [Antrihabitans sp. YC2-6]